MHLGRFHRAIEMLATDYRELKPVELIQKVITSLNAVATTPTAPDIATAFKTQLDICRATLESSRLNHTRPILQLILESIDAPKFVGSQLSNSIVAAIAMNQAAPALAVQELTKLNQEVTQFYQHIVAIDTAFSKLNVEYDDLEEGESEIGLLVPRDENASTLKDLAKEFNDWNNALSQIAILFDHEAKPLQIRTCSTTDWMIYIEATPAIIGGVFTCVKGVNAILKELLETRSLIEQLVTRKVSNLQTEALLKENLESFDLKIRSMAEELVNTHAGKSIDSGTKNEMKNGINIALKIIAAKINQGAKIELRLIPPVIPVASTEVAADGSAKPTPIDKEEVNRIHRLQELSLKLDDSIDLVSLDSTSDTLAALLAAPEQTPKQK